MATMMRALVAMAAAGVAEDAREEISLPHFLEFVRRTLVAEVGEATHACM